MIYHKGPRVASEGKLIFKKKEMSISQNKSQIPGYNYWPQYYLHRLCKGQGHYGLAGTNKGQGSVSLSQSNKLLLIIYMDLLWLVTRTDCFTQKEHQIQVDKSG